MRSCVKVHRLRTLSSGKYGDQRVVFVRYTEGYKTCSHTYISRYKTSAPRFTCISLCNDTEMRMSIQFVRFPLAFQTARVICSNPPTNTTMERQQHFFVLIFHVVVCFFPTRLVNRFSPPPICSRIRFLPAKRTSRALLEINWGKQIVRLRPECDIDCGLFVWLYFALFFFFFNCVRPFCNQIKTIAVVGLAASF